MERERFGAYICTCFMLQAIFIYRQFGTLASTVSINQNITGFVGNKDTHLTCSFFLEKDEEFLSVEIIAKNITGNFDEKKPIVIFEPGRTTELHPTGKYLLGRVTLTNITKTSTNATLNFNVLKRTDEKDYICKYYYRDKFRVFSIKKSEETRILVKVPVREVQIKNQPNERQYDRSTDNISLTCKASGDPEPSYTWFKEDSSDIIISKTNVYVIQDVIQNNSGVYTCEAYNNINNVNFTHSSSIEIDIVDEMLQSPEKGTLENSSEHAAYAVPVILALVVVVIVSFLAVKKHLCNRPTKDFRKNKERWHNMLGCFNKRYDSDENPSYAVVDKKEPGDVSNDMNEIEIICKNNEKVLENNCDISSNLPKYLDNIYAVPCDTQQVETVTSKMGKDREKNGNKGVSNQDAVYSEVFNETNMNYEMSKERTLEHPDTVDHNGDGIYADQFHV